MNVIWRWTVFLWLISTEDWLSYCNKTEGCIVDGLGAMAPEGVWPVSTLGPSGPVNGEKYVQTLRENFLQYWLQDKGGKRCSSARHHSWVDHARKVPKWKNQNWLISMPWLVPTSRLNPIKLLAFAWNAVLYKQLCHAFITAEWWKTQAQQFRKSSNLSWMESLMLDSFACMCW